MVIFAREKKKLHVKNIKFCALEKFFSSREKNENTAREKKNVGVKKLKNGPKSGREKRKVPVKKNQKMPKIGFTGTFYFHGKKKHCGKPWYTISRAGRYKRQHSRIVYSR